jgi:hypothetical protein
MFKAVGSTKKRKEYAQEVTFIEKRSRRGRIKHEKINVTPSSSQISSSPSKHDSQAEELNVIPSLSFSIPPSPLPVDQNDYSQLGTDSPPLNSGGHKSSKRGKACLLSYIHDLLSQLNCLASRPRTIFFLTGFPIAMII